MNKLVGRKILGIDTSTDACSVALLLPSGEIIERFEATGRQHSQLVLPMVDEILSKAGYELNQLDAIAVTRGPGSFTGVRIGISVAQGLAFGADLRVISVSTLAAIAWGALDRENQIALVAIDARMEEVYFGAYARGENGIELLGEEKVCTPKEVVLPEGVEVESIIAVGNGWQEYAALLPKFSGVKILEQPIFNHPRASSVVALGYEKLMNGETLSPFEIVPIYLRDQVCSVPIK